MAPRTIIWDGSAESWREMQDAIDQGQELIITRLEAWDPPLPGERANYVVHSGWRTVRVNLLDFERDPSEVPHEATSQTFIASASAELHDTARRLHDLARRLEGGAAE